MKKIVAMTLRPYQLLSVVCALGGDPAERRDRKIRGIITAIRKTPDLPLTLCCNFGEVFGYQDPGVLADTPEGAEFNVRRDLEILHKLNLFPGSTLPARMIFMRLWDRIPNVTGICTYGRVTSATWQGWPKAKQVYYWRGHRRGIAALIFPRTKRGMRKAKQQSLAAMVRADVIDVRPHIMLCSVCQYGGGMRPPYLEDNLPELIQFMLQTPDIRIRLAPHADWMMCAPCPYRVPGINACVNNMGNGGVSNQMRDLRVLQKLGLKFGDTLGARDLYKRILKRLPSTLEICRLDHAGLSVWSTGCGAKTENSPGYAKGRKLLMKALGL